MAMTHTGESQKDLKSDPLFLLKMVANGMSLGVVLRLSKVCDSLHPARKEQR